jgi:uncharacterized protein YndB with AHSA1/START domain
MATESIHVTALIPASPRAVYDAWLSSEQHTRMTGGAARVDPQVGGDHSAWDDYITGNTLELVPGARIVQSWRTTHFPSESGPSQIMITFEPESDQTRVKIAHTDIPEGQGASYESGWHEHYFTPMSAYFTAGEKLAKRPAARKAAARKPAKAAAKKPAPKKAAPKKKPAPKKAAPKKKPAARKAAPKKPASKKAAPKKSGS